ncbi:MAG: ClbS/DfsB family four-helix bundle protein [Candidatus Thorarchaeota archaeon]|jgi:hypothetical protein
MSETPSKADLVLKIRQSHELVESMASKLTNEELMMPGAQGDRSVKDIIAHITAWNIRGTKWIQSVANNERPVLPMEGLTAEKRPERFKQLNQEIHEQNKDKSIEQVMNEFQEASDDLLNHIEVLRDEQLEAVFEFDWMDGKIPGWQIVAWRYYHCQSHGRFIDLLLNSDEEE